MLKKLYIFFNKFSLRLIAYWTSLLRWSTYYKDEGGCKGNRTPKCSIVTDCNKRLFVEIILNP